MWILCLVSDPSCCCPGVVCPSHMCFNHSRCVPFASTASLGVKWTVTTSPSSSQTLAALLSELCREIVKEVWDVELEMVFHPVQPQEAASIMFNQLPQPPH